MAFHAREQWHSRSLDSILLARATSRVIGKTWRAESRALRGNATAIPRSAEGLAPACGPLMRITT